MLVKIIYGTCGGNTEIVCEKVKEVIESLGHKVELLKAKISSPADLHGSDLLILASPTYGHGLLEAYMDKFIASCKGADLKSQKAAVIGLGSFIYDMDYFIESEKILTEFLLKSGAEIVFEPLKITKAPYPFLNKMIPKWTNDVINKL